MEMVDLQKLVAGLIPMVLTLLFLLLLPRLFLGVVEVVLRIILLSLLLWSIHILTTLLIGAVVTFLYSHSNRTKATD